MAKAKLISVGKFLGAHGVRGQLKLASFTEDPENITAYGALTDATGQRTFDLTLHRWNKSHFIAMLKGVTDREAAEKLKGVELFVERARLPKAKANQYYYSDLIGLRAVLADGAMFGEVTDVRNYGAGDILEIKLTSGKTELYSFNPQVVGEVDLAAGTLVINPPEWLDTNDRDADEPA